MLPLKIVCDMVFYIKNYTRPVFIAPAGIIFMVIWMVKITLLLLQARRQVQRGASL